MNSVYLKGKYDFAAMIRAQALTNQYPRYEFPVFPSLGDIWCRYELMKGAAVSVGPLTCAQIFESLG